MRLHKQSLKLGKCWNESRLVKLFSETEWLRVTRTEGRDWIINRNDRLSSCSRKLHNDMKSGWNRFKHLKKHYSVKKTDAINLLSPRWYCRHKQTLLARRLVKIISDITFPRRRIHSGQINDLKQAAEAEISRLHWVCKFGFHRGEDGGDHKQLVRVCGTSIIGLVRLDGKAKPTRKKLLDELNRSF